MKTGDHQQFGAQKRNPGRPIVAEGRFLWMLVFSVNALLAQGTQVWAYGVDPEAAMQRATSHSKAFKKWLALYQKELHLLVQRPEAFRKAVVSGRSQYLKSLACLEALSENNGPGFIEKLTAPVLKDGTSIQNYMLAQEVLLRHGLAAQSGSSEAIKDDEPCFL